jgi:hypothetical protein
MVRSISVSIGRMVGFLDQSPCMNQTKFCSYNSFSATVLMVFGTTLNRTQPVIDRFNGDYFTAKLEQHGKTKKQKIFFFFFFSKTKTELKLKKRVLKQN